jgi:ribosome modulation factor
MKDDSTARSGSIHQPTNPYDDDTHPNAHRAYREGWQARLEAEPHTVNPYGCHGAEIERAWLNGWLAAHLRRAQRNGAS